MADITKITVFNRRRLTRMPAIAIEAKTAALRAAYSAINNDTVQYKWKNWTSCNCGVVAQAVTGKTAQQLDEMYKDIDGTWTANVQTFCPITGEPVLGIFKALFKVGFDARELVELEFLRNEEICQRAGLEPMGFIEYYGSRINVLKYLRAWIEIEEEKLKPKISLSDTSVSEEGLVLEAAAAE